MWVPALHPALGAASRRDRSISKTGGGHPAVVVLEAGGVLGKPPWEMSLCLAHPRQGMELDLDVAPHVGTFEFCAAVGTTLTVGLFSGRVAFLLHHGPLLLPTVWFILNGNDFKSSIRTNKLPKVKTIETAFY